MNTKVKVEEVVHSATLQQTTNKCPNIGKTKNEEINEVFRSGVNSEMSDFTIFLKSQKNMR